MNTSSFPQQPEAETRRILAAHGVESSSAALLGVRGYYRDTMGSPGRNDRGLYDDAIFVVAPGVYLPFRANTDPSAHRRGIAMLYPGKYLYKIGIHGLSRPPARRYTALVQAGPVTIRRDGAAAPESGWYGINIHRGGESTTSSLGCQTLPPADWPRFLAAVQQALRTTGQTTLAYVLVERIEGT